MGGCLSDEDFKNDPNVQRAPADQVQSLAQEQAPPDAGQADENEDARAALTAKRKAAKELRAKEREERAAQKRRDQEEERQEAIRNKNSCVFGISTKEAAIRSDPDNQMVVAPVKICMAWIEAHGLDAEGLFRIPGSLCTVKEYRKKIDRGEYLLEISPDEKVENVASLVVRYLNDYNMFTDVPGIFNGKEWIKEVSKFQRRLCRPKKTEAPLSEAEIVAQCKELLLALNHDPAIVEVIRQITLILREASKEEHTKNNMMTPKKFSLCTFPAIMQFVEQLILYHDQVFPITFPNGKSSPPNTTC